jgi:hypothetical protein
MFQEYEVVRLRESKQSNNLPAGVKGTVLIVYDEPGLPLAYEVEFLDDEGKTLAVLTVKHEEIEKA